MISYRDEFPLLVQSEVFGGCEIHIWGPFEIWWRCWSYRSILQTMVVHFAHSMHYLKKKIEHRISHLIGWTENGHRYIAIHGVILASNKYTHGMLMWGLMKN